MNGYHMEGFSGYSVKYSPFYDNKLAIASGANFGLVGNGKLYILDINNQGKLEEYNSFITQDCLFDTAWNELHENQLVVAQGDGSLRLFDITQKDYPIAVFKEHEREVLSCNWNLVNKNTFISSSWDGTVKIWSPLRPNSLSTLIPNPMKVIEYIDRVDIPLSHQNAHSDMTQNRNCIYQSIFSPHDPNLILTCAGNSYITLFDMRQAATANNQQNFLSHGGLETLTCDFNKYRPNIIASGGVDNAIRIWDLRMIETTRGNLSATTTTRPKCVNEVSKAHELAVRKVVWSPHESTLLLSASYDMTCSVWRDLSFNGKVPTNRTNNTHIGKGCITRFGAHTEFVFGIDWSLWGKPGYIASTAWDGNAYIWKGY
ncbi:peroxisomal targeting signal 2 receptor [Maudiozyma exigua]|uniref:Peroxin-7 n=1 Tax=Maudiozyma exigua TaxID=34358 RepID=A0A9P7B3T6_MAUEX|nr:peroxisomal targeting signal 2 receptor [Kazachstania exigua]